MKLVKFFFVLLFALFPGFTQAQETVSVLDRTKFSLPQERRYLLYEVNMGEGFNLRRDVYMRVAGLVRQLRNSGYNYFLVLPPWGALYHWQTFKLGEQIKIPWSLWFDLDSLNRFVPVVELHDYLRGLGAPLIDAVYHLQHFSNWDKFEEKYEFIRCSKVPYYQETPGHWKGWFWKYDEIYASNFSCLAVMGFSKTLMPLILSSWNTSVRSIMIDRAEVILHDEFGSADYWKARRSMRYSQALRNIADDFRRAVLNSTDAADLTKIDPDWTRMKVYPGQAIGGAYLAVHWRRRDYLRAHGAELPSIKGTAAALESLTGRLKLDVIFLATDAAEEEVEELKSHLPPGLRMERFVPSSAVLHKYKDGGVSIIDQWICAHARFFIGTYASTFSYRIHEDREILGFDPETTFNRLCPDDKPDCEQPAKWHLVQ